MLFPGEGGGGGGALEEDGEVSGGAPMPSTPGGSKTCY